MTDFRPPADINELISAHLTTSTALARRVGVAHKTVLSWLTYPDFASLAIPLSGGGLAFWWPEAKECLAELSLPQRTADGGVQQPRKHRRPRTVCPVCERDVQKRSNGTPITHYPPPDRKDLACGDTGGHCRGSHIEAAASA